MELERLQADVRRLMQGIEHPRAAVALALTEECGEVVRCVLERLYYGAENADALAGEIGDVLLALTELCDRFGLSLSSCADGAVAKLERKAPEWRAELGDRLQRLRALEDGADDLTTP